MQGINNLGGTCAINSLIQIICRCDKLREIILKSNIELENSFINELKDILDLMYNQNKSLNPIRFITNFYKIFDGIFNKYEQIDINELWLFISNKLLEELGESIPKLTNINSINDMHDSQINIYNNHKQSKLNDLIQGTYINVIECLNCKHKSYSFEPFISINLDIYDNNKSIAELFINSLTIENREADEWKCENCLNKCKYRKTKRIWKIPEILFISLNRFNGMTKNEMHVYINYDLNFNKGTVETKDKDCRYILQGLGMHYGNLSGGHYTAICNMKNDTFNIYNDNIINTVKKDDFMYSLNNNTAYLIVYERE